MKKSYIPTFVAFCIMIFTSISCDDNMDKVLTQEINKSREEVIITPGDGEATPDDGEATPDDGEATPGEWKLFRNTGIALKDSASVIYGGWLYVHGGENVLGTVNSFWRINLTTCSIESLGADIYASGHDMVVIDGLLYLFGGKDENGNAINSFRTYDLNNIGSSGWKVDIVGSDTNGPFPSARYGHRTVTYNGYLYVYGGINDSGVIDNTLYRFDPLDTPKPRWIKLNTEGPALAGSGAAVHNDSLYVFGGFDSAVPSGNTYVNTYWKYDFISDQWSYEAVPSEVSPRGWMQFAEVGDNIVFLWGEGTGGTLNDSWNYDLASIWNVISVEPEARSFYNFRSWGEQAVVYGGYNSNTSRYYDDIWILSLE